MKKAAALLLSLLLILSLCTFSFAANKNETITNTLDLASLYQNGSGPGYDWNNMEDTLTLNNIKIETDDDVGLKVPETATIVLKGNNYIKASSIAMTCVNSMTITGNGTLTLVADDTGIISYSLSSEDIIRLKEGKINITAKNFGIFSEYAAVTFAGATVNIASEDYSVKAENVKFTGGKNVLTGKVGADDKLTVSGCDLTVSANAPALEGKRSTEISGVKISAGNSESVAVNVEKYDGENFVKFTNTVSGIKKGILFGGNLPKFVDYIAFILLILAASAVIAVPIIIKKKKTDKLIKQNEALKKSSKSSAKSKK